MPPHERACARAKNYLLSLLSDDPQEQDWLETCAKEIESFLDDDKTTDVLSCLCNSCVDGRRRCIFAQNNDEASFWATKMAGSKRLFAICIITDLPCLIYSFLHHSCNDNWFDECIAPTKLKSDVDLSLQDAKALLDEKEKFFDGGRISLFTYMRSLRPAREPPLTEEENWIIDEFLIVSDKLALEPHARARKIPPSATIKDLMIRDSPARPRDREAQHVEGLGGQTVSVQSLGNLTLDLICFIAGGGNYVQALDKRRTSSVNWFKEMDWTALHKVESCRKIFRFVQLMIYPDEDFGGSKESRGNNDFKHISQQFHRIWPRHTTENSHADPEKERQSDATSLSSQGLGNPVSCKYEEIEPDEFRSMHLRCQREGHQQKKCQIGVFKSMDNKSIQLDLLSFDRDLRNPSSFYASPKDVRFIPLYAYNNHHGLDEFSAKFQLVPGSSEKMTIPYTFRFKSIKDVKIFQTAVTSRIIEKDVALKESILVLRKKNRMFGTGKPQRCSFSAGRLQIWRVLDKKALKEIHETANLGIHGVRQYPLRAELIIFGNHGFFVIGVKSVLRLKDLPDNGLRIESKEKGTKASLEGKRLSTDDTQYPGIPLFQTQLFNTQEGEGVVCDSIELRLSSKGARDELSQYLEEQYISPSSPGRS